MYYFFKKEIPAFFSKIEKKSLAIEKNIKKMHKLIEELKRFKKNSRKYASRVRFVENELSTLENKTKILENEIQTLRRILKYMEIFNFFAGLILALIYFYLISVFFRNFLQFFIEMRTISEGEAILISVFIISAVHFILQTKKSTEFEFEKFMNKYSGYGFTLGIVIATLISLYPLIKLILKEFF